MLITHCIGRHTPCAFLELVVLMITGHVDTHHGVYVMHWPGLLILFPLNALPAASWQDMQQGRAPPTALADGRAPVACRMCIHAGNAGTMPIHPHY